MTSDDLNPATRMWSEDTQLDALEQKAEGGERQLETTPRCQECGGDRAGGVRGCSCEDGGTWTRTLSGEGNAMPDEPYVVFGMDYYYPCGGWSDFRSRHATAEEATEAALKLVETTEMEMGGYKYLRSDVDFVQVVDVRDGTIFETYQKEGR